MWYPAAAPPTSSEVVAKGGIRGKILGFDLLGGLYLTFNCSAGTAAHEGAAELTGQGEGTDLAGLLALL